MSRNQTVVSRARSVDQTESWPDRCPPLELTHYPAAASVPWLAPRLCAGVALLFVCGHLVACTPGLYKRDAQAEIEGPSQIIVGRSVLLTARLE